jgi:hypothetical protein
MALTNPDDKLVALSGIAKARAASFGDTYIAGMWRQELVHQLLWRTNDNSIKSRPVVYRAPSWSWASIERQVIYRRKTNDDHVLYHIEDVHLTHATQDTTGRILSGWLQVRACLKPTRLTWHIHAESNDLNQGHWDMLLDNADEKLHNGIMFDAHPLNHTSFDEDNAQDRLFYIPTMKWTRKSDLVACGLLLRVVDRDEGVFERLGLIHDGWGKHLPAILADLEEEVKKSLPCIRYEDGMHTIHII